MQHRRDPRAHEPTRPARHAPPSYEPSGPSGPVNTGVYGEGPFGGYVPTHEPGYVPGYVPGRGRVFDDSLGGDGPYEPYAPPGYGPLRTEREAALERRLAQAEGHARALDEGARRLERQLAESRRRLFQWRLRARNGVIAFLTTFIAVWAGVSALVRYPVLPWDMPGVILSLLGR